MLGNLIGDSTSGNGYSSSVGLTNTYDSLGNRTTSALSIDGTADYLNTYSYDSLGNETRVTQQGQAGGDAVAEKRVDMNYNADGQFTSIDTYADLADTENVVSAAYGYDGAGRLTSLSYTAQSSTLAGYTFGYNQYNEITSFISSQYGTAGFGLHLRRGGTAHGGDESQRPRRRGSVQLRRQRQPQQHRICDGREQQVGFGWHVHLSVRRQRQHDPANRRIRRIHHLRLRQPQPLDDGHRLHERGRRHSDGDLRLRRLKPADRGSRHREWHDDHDQARL